MLNVFGNGTDGVSWSSEPAKRGTFGILSSCLVTILLCVWTALHLNIPSHKDEKRHWICKRSLWRKVSWLMFALIAPELVAYTAFYQRSEAQKLRKSFRKLNDNLKEGTGGQEKGINDLSMTQAFYALMGGYQIHVPAEKNLFPEDYTHLALGRNTLHDFAETYPHALKITPDSEIRDKSKANSFAKLLVCVQASWFMLQCITRVAMSLSITLLELNTLGHSLCALLIYVFWWHKPLDIEKPTLITGPEAEKYAAYLWLTSKSGTAFGIRNITPLDRRERETNLYEMARKDRVSGSEINDLYARGFISEEACTRALALKRSSARYKTRRSEYWAVRDRSDEESLIDFMVTPSRTQQTSQEILFDPEEAISQAHESTENHEGESNCDPKHVRMVDGLYYNRRIYCLGPNGLYSREMNPVNSDAIVSRASELIKKKLTVGLITYEPPFLPEDIEDRLRNLPHELSPSGFMGFGWNEERGSKQLILCLYTCGILYGGLHLLAWFATLSSSTERLIWRISSATVIASMPVIDVLGLVIKYVSAGYSIIASVFYHLSILLRWFCIVFYFIARAYLVVECFIALAHSPIGVYQVPQWSNYVPHIG